MTHCFSILSVQRDLSLSRRLAGPLFCIGNEQSRTVHKSGVLPVQACRRPRSFVRNLQRLLRRTEMALRTLFKGTYTLSEPFLKGFTHSQLSDGGRIIEAPADAASCSFVAAPQPLDHCAAPPLSHSIGGMFGGARKYRNIGGRRRDNHQPASGSTGNFVRRCQSATYGTNLHHAPSSTWTLPSIAPPSTRRPLLTWFGV